MDKVKLIRIYKSESNYAFNLIPDADIEKFVDMVFEAYDNEKTIFAAGKVV